MAGMRDDESGVMSAVEFILTFVMAAFIFTIFIMSVNGLFLDQSKNVVGTNQFTDVCNDVSTKIIETYLVAPEKDGKIVTYFEIPQSISGIPYNITICKKESPVPGEYGADESIQVASADGNIVVRTTLNAAWATIPINGTTNSTSRLHMINYTVYQIGGV